MGLVEVVGLIWKTAKGLGDSLRAEIALIEAQYSPEIEPQPPRLDVPASKKHILAATKALQKEHDHVAEIYKCGRAQIDRRCVGHVSLLEQVDKMSQRFVSRVSTMAEEDELRGYGDAARLDLAFFSSKRACEYGWAEVDSQRLQTCLQKMMEGQEEELKEWFFMEVLSEFATHVTQAEECLRPLVTIEYKRSVLSDTQLSPEVMSLVYEYADLESCVSLRQVNSHWYNAFNRNDDFWRLKMRARNPWVEPGEADLKSWVDCVLVFCARLKWPSVMSLNDISVDEKKSERKTVVGFELGLNEKLPINFTGMMPIESGCTVACDHFFAMAAWETQEFIRDLWTLSSRPKDEPYEIVAVDDEEGTVIKYRDVVITMPPSIKPADIVPFSGLNTPVHLGTMIVTVELQDGRMISMPRDNAHYEKGYIFNGAGASLFQIGNVHFARETPGLIHRAAVYRYRFADFESKQMVEYGAGRHAYPVASYNGLVWWHLLKGPRSLVPTFVDLQSPKRVYFLPQRAITGVSHNLFEQSCISRISSQFVVALSDTGIEIVDLDTGVITAVTGPSDWPAARFFPGYWNGKFQTRCMSEEVVQATTELVLQEHGVPEQEWRV